MHRATPRLSYTVTEALDATGLTRTRFYALLADGTLPTFKLGRRRMVSARALSGFIDRLEREATPKEAA